MARGYDAVVFDLYGTLVNISERTDPLFRLFNEIWQAGPSSSVRKTALTQEFPDVGSLVNEIAPYADIDIEYYQHMVDKEIDSVVLFPDVVSVLSGLREQGYRTALISNLVTPYKEPCERFGLPGLMDVTFFSCERGMRKPTPEVYRTTARELGTTPSRALMVGDSFSSDILGPRAVGMKGVLIDRYQNNGKAELATLEDIFTYL